MNIFANIREEIISTLSELFPQVTNFSAIVVEPPKDLAHGDMATNAAMVLAKPLAMKPLDIAQKLVKNLEHKSIFKSINIAGPGFINIKLQEHLWYQVVINILEQGRNFGNSNIGKKTKVNVEYVSANPTGPMHIGHARGAVYGDALASLLEKAGFAVTREYYINDAGSQMDTLSRSAYLRYLQAAGQNIGDIPSGLYPGQYLIPVGEELYKKYGKQLINQSEEQYLPLIREFAVLAMLELIKKDLADLGVKHDIFVSEKKLQDQGKIPQAIKLLENNGLVYRGVLDAPKGKTPEDWEAREQLLFKASNFGDDIDRPLQKSDGSYTYFAADIAYHLDKINRGYDNMVIVLGADHGGYVKRLKAIVAALSDNRAQIDVKIAQLVNFMIGGEAMKMSKRKGSFTTVRDVINEVGSDVIRFIMLTRKNDMVLDFDLDLVKEQSKDNPVFYVQYAHARCCSVLRLATKESPISLSKKEKIDSKILSLLSDEAELNLIRVLSSWPRIVESSAIAHEPHRIAFFLHEVASSFHSLWNKGKDNAMLKFITSDVDATAARLALVEATRNVIASGLCLLNVVPLENMD